MINFDSDKETKGYPDDVSEALVAYDNAQEAQRDWRDAARTAFDYRAGKQWEDDDMARLEGQGRPAVTFNRVAPIVDAIIGYEMDNQREVTYLGRNINDEPIAGAFTDMAQYVRDGCDADDEESEAYADTITSGMGWTETRVSYDDDPQGDILIERVAPLEMRWDPSARGNNLHDADWVCRVKWWKLDEIKARWPDKEADLEAMQNDAFDDDTSDSDSAHDATNAWKYDSDTAAQWENPDKEVRVLQYQWREKEEVVVVTDPQDPNKVLEFTPERWEKLQEGMMEDMPMTKVRRWKYYQQMIAGQTLLEETEAPAPNGFSFQCITGKRDENKNEWFGLVRQMIDPQKWANVFFSSALHSFQNSAKGGVMAEEGVVDDKRDFEEAWASADSVLWLEDGALSGGRVQPKEQNSYPAGLDKLMSFAIQAIRDCTGVNLEMLGMVGHEQSGVVESERKKSALTILAPLVASLKRYRKRQGRVLISLMTEVFTPEQVSMITERQVPFWQDETVRKYRVIVDEAASSPNQKSEAWSAMQQILPAVIKAGLPVPPQLLKYTPLPDKLATEWIQFAEQQSGGGDSEQMQKQIQELQQALQETQKQVMGEQIKLQTAQMAEQTKMASISMEERTHERRIAGQERLKQLAILADAQISDADREVRKGEIQVRYETDVARISSQESIAARDDMNALRIARENNSSDERIAGLKARVDALKIHSQPQGQLPERVNE